MFVITALALIVCGCLAAAPTFVKKRPDASKVLDKLIPYQGWFGVVVCIWGLWTVINALIHVGWLRYFALWWLTYFATGLMCVVLGFILGFILIDKYILSKNAGSETKGQALKTKLVAHQVTLGYVGIGLGLWCLIAWIIWM